VRDDERKIVNVVPAMPIAKKIATPTP